MSGLLFPAFLKEEASSTSSKRLNYDLMTCKFPGTKVFSLVQSLQKLKSEVDSQDVKIRDREGWLTPYNIRHNFTSNWRVLEPMRRQQVLAKALNDLENKAWEALEEVFDNATVRKAMEPVRTCQNAVRICTLQMLYCTLFCSVRFADQATFICQTTTVTYFYQFTNFVHFNVQLSLKEGWLPK